MPRKKKDHPEVVDHWTEIFDEIEIKSVPIEYLRSIFVHFHNGKVWEIAIDKTQRLKPTFDLDKKIEGLLAEYEEEILHIDFRLDTEKVKKDIGKRTHTFMKKRR